MVWKLYDPDCYLIAGLNDGIRQLCLKRLIYSRLEFHNVSTLGNVYFDLAWLSVLFWLFLLFFHLAPQSGVRFIRHLNLG